MDLQLGLLKFEDVRAAIKNYFNEVRGIDYYDGNNFSIFVDALAYIQEMMAYQLSQQASNAMTRNAPDRKTAVENAYRLGYIPARKTPNRLLLGTGYTPVGQDVLVYGSRTGLPFTIYGNTSVAIQEEIKTVYVPGTGLSNQSFTIPTKHIGNGAITVSLTSGVDLEFTQFEIFDQIPTSTSKIFFVSEENEFTTITFGNGIIGYIPSQTDTIEIKYYETHGSEGNDELGLENIDAEIINTYAGRDLETRESIVVNAAKYHSSRGRLVTKNDYTNYYRTKAAEVDVSENASGVNYYYAGNVYVSVVPTGVINGIEDLNDELSKTTGYDSKKLIDWRSGNCVAYIGELSSASVIDDSDIRNKRIIGTSAVVSSPTYLFCDISPTIESVISGYRYSLNDRLGIRNSAESFAQSSMFGFDVDFRNDYISKHLFSNYENLKSIKYDNGYCVVFDLDNLTDSFSTILPDDFVATNDDYYLLDNNFLGNYYEKSSMPVERRVLYSRLEDRTIRGLTFERHLFNGGSEISADSYSDILIFDYDSTTTPTITNKQSFNVFSSTSVFALTIDSTGNLLMTETSRGNVSAPVIIGTVDFTGGHPNITLIPYGNGTDTNWNELLNYTVTKSSKTRYNLRFVMIGNTTTGTQVGKQYMTIQSQATLGSLFVDETGKLDLEKNNLGEFTIKNSDNNHLMFQFVSGAVTMTAFTIVNNSGVFSVESVGEEFSSYITNTPIIVGSSVIISEKLVDGTWIGEFDRTTETVNYERILSGKNNTNIPGFIGLSDFLTDNAIVTNGVKYCLNIKPKYKIVNDKLIYKQDFDKKSGLYKIININTPENRQ